MPWQYEPTKDAAAGETPRGDGKQSLIRGCPNGETYTQEVRVLLCRGAQIAGTMRSETSQ